MKQNICVSGDVDAQTPPSKQPLRFVEAENGSAELPENADLEQIDAMPGTSVTGGGEPAPSMEPVVTV